MDIIDLLNKWQNNCKRSEETLKILIYDHLKKICKTHLQSHRTQVEVSFIANNLSTTTCLLHQSLLELVPPNYTIEHKAQFNRYLSLFVRNLLLDEVRKLSTQKRTPQQLEETDDLYSSPEAYIAIERALTKLDSLHPAKADIFSQHYFLGLDTEQLAQQLGISKSTVYRQLETAKAFIKVHS